MQQILAGLDHLSMPIVVFDVLTQHRKGVYIAKYADYSLKYSNSLQPLQLGQVVEVLMLQVLLGKTFRFHGKETGCDPKPGYDRYNTNPLYSFSHTIVMPFLYCSLSYVNCFYHISAE